MANEERKRLLAELSTQLYSEKFGRPPRQTDDRSSFPTQHQEESLAGEEEATKLLSSPLTLFRGMEMVLGRPVYAKELKTDEDLKGIADPSLDGETRYGLLLFKKSMESMDQQKDSGDL